MDTVHALLSYLQDPETPLGVMDPVYSTFLVYGLVRGLFLGLPEEVARVAGTVLVLFGSRMFYSPVSELLLDTTSMENEQVSVALAYLLLALIFFIAWRLTIFLVKKLLDWTFPDLTHRPGGAVVGLIKSAIILCVILTVVQITGQTALQEHMIRRSWLGRTLSVFLPASIEEIQTDWLPGGRPAPEKDPKEDGSGNA